MYRYQLELAFGTDPPYEQANLHQCYFKTPVCAILENFKDDKKLICNDLQLHCQDLMSLMLVLCDVSAVC